MTDRIVIVGGGLAGGNAAATLREEGFTGPVTVVTREPGVPFGRPPLSKTYLRSEEALDGWYVRPAAWYDEHGVERLTDEVAGIDATAHTVALGSGRPLEYDKLLIASGGQPHHLRLPGADLDGVHYLRTVADCDAIKQEARPGRRAVVIGMGFIGCEVAASLTQLGVQVTAVFGGRYPLERVLGEQVGAIMGDIHREQGVTLLAGDEAAQFAGDGRVSAVLTAGGTRVPCDFVVAGIGISPEVPAVTGGSLDHNNGILVDEHLRTSVPDIYAAGDVASVLHPLFGRVRVEHYNNAEKQGAFAARAMLGSDAPYEYLYTFWSDQYDHKIEYAGYVTKWDDFVVRGRLADRSLIGFYLVDGVVRAAVGLDRGGDPELDADSEMAASARLVAQRAAPGADQLADEKTDLWSLTGDRH
ncbi:MAG TPA: FAD-dependent oxidoreductase [Streptosporangiaceae bacterium]|nr:FAD-dependent oxidoreductase [Streptosporangiaceae bacterium]